MYFWNIQALSEDLKERRVSQREKMKYLLATAISHSISLPISISVAWALGITTLLANVALSIWGIVLCYQANRQGDDEEFIDRYICIRWPIYIRLFVLVGIPVALVFMSVGVSPDRVTIVDLIAAIVFRIIYYLWIRTDILKISDAASDSSN
ncbi:hypothetical protein HYR99_30920 [Candidatus Poribacteria bacterium]|nr:hypothetical protein [Candidatus Poribacteria bacterium]